MRESERGVVGLTRSFMCAGTRSILMTHWSVESKAVRDWMVGAFQNKRERTIPDALRAVKLTMKNAIRQAGREKPFLSHPFFWAPFVLLGEGE